MPAVAGWSWNSPNSSDFHASLLIAASYLCNKFLHFVPSKIWIVNENMKGQGGVAPRITIVVEVLVTLWGRKDEFKCGIAACLVL